MQVKYGSMIGGGQLLSFYLWLLIWFCDNGAPKEGVLMLSVMEYREA